MPSILLESVVPPVTVPMTLPLGAVGHHGEAVPLGCIVNIFSVVAILMLAGIAVSAVFTLLPIPVIYTKRDRFAFAAHVHEAEERERRNRPA